MASVRRQVRLPLGPANQLSNNPEVSMLARPTLTKPVQDDAITPKTQTRPTEERFLLRVDGQIKRSLATKKMRQPPGR